MSFFQLKINHMIKYLLYSLTKVIFFQAFNYKAIFISFKWKKNFKHLGGNICETENKQIKKQSLDVYARFGVSKENL